MGIITNLLDELLGIARALERERAQRALINEVLLFTAFAGSQGAARPDVEFISERARELHQEITDHLCKVAREDEGE